MMGRDTDTILASTYVIALACLVAHVGCTNATPVALPAAAPISTAVAAPRIVDDAWCGEVIHDRDALHALVEARIAEHSAAFSACAPAQRERVVVRAEISLNVCGRASLGTATPNVPFTATEQCIDRVLGTIPFASIGDMKFWHSHEFVLGGRPP